MSIYFIRRFPPPLKTAPLRACCWPPGFAPRPGASPDLGSMEFYGSYKTEIMGSNGNRIGYPRNRSWDIRRPLPIGGARQRRGDKRWSNKASRGKQAAKTSCKRQEARWSKPKSKQDVEKESEQPARPIRSDSAQCYWFSILRIAMGLTRESYIGMSQPISGCPLRITNMLRSREVAGNCWAAHVQLYLMGGLGGTHKWFVNFEDMMASNFGGKSFAATAKSYMTLDINVELRSHGAFQLIPITCWSPLVGFCTRMW